MIVYTLFYGLAILAAPESGRDMNTDGYAAVVRQEASLVAYWRMEGDLRDEVSGNAAKPEARFATCPSGGILVLDGTSPVVVEGADALDTAESFVSFLFRLTGPGEGNPGLVAKRSNEKTRFSLHVAADRRGLAMWNGTGVRWTVLPETMRIEDGRWYHLAVSSGGPSGFALYLNGASCLMDGFGSFNLLERQLPLVLGAAQPDNMEGASCELDELAFFNRALPPETVADHVDSLGLREEREALTAEFSAIKAQRLRTQQEAAAERDRLRQALLSDPNLLERGEPRIYRGENLEAISLPVGGIGAGLIQMDGRATSHIWQIHNNHIGVRVPDSFFAIAVGQDGERIVRALQTEAAGAFEPMAGLSFEGRYPFGWYRFEDDALPAEVSLGVFNPLIPLNPKDSAIPCAIFTVTVGNPTNQPLDVALLGTQQNVVGLMADQVLEGRANSGYGKNVNACVHLDGLTALHMTQPPEPGASGTNSKNGTSACCPGSVCSPGQCVPSMTLALLEESAKATVSWTDSADLRNALVAGPMPEGPSISQPSQTGETHNGAISCTFQLAPGMTEKRTFILTWYLPNEEAGRWGGQGVMYTNWWRNSLEVARDVAARLKELTAATRLYVDSLYESNLPYWLLDRISSQVAVLRSKTCYWSRDGYFGGWEGCCPGTGCCAGNCAHVWHYAQAYARLFPQLARKMREQAFAFDQDGGILFRQTPDWTNIAIDGQCGEILGAYREHLCSVDDTWLRGQWPRIKRAMDYTIHRWDEDGDGMLHGPLHNTLDIDSTGTASWWGSLYLASLQASACMARAVGDDASSQHYLGIWNQGRENQDTALWNGEYYAQVVDEQPLYDYVNGCSIDLALGEWWAGQTGLLAAYPKSRVQDSLRALFQHNFQPNFHGIQQTPRKFVSDSDAGMQMITWPGSDRPTPHTLYADEVMSGFEYAAAATMLQYGLLSEGFTVVKSIADRYDGRIRRDVSAGEWAAWGYTGNPFGDDECGKFYARAMSSWSLLLAVQGFVYEGPSGRIGFRPVWKPEDHASFFTAAEGYGLYRQLRKDRTQTCTLNVRAGKIEVAEFISEVPSGWSVARVTVRLENAEIPADFLQTGDDCMVRLLAPVALRPDMTLEIHLHSNA